MTLLDVRPGDGKDGCRAVGGGGHHAEWFGAPAHDGGAARGHHRVRGQEGGQVRLHSCEGGVMIKAVSQQCQRKVFTLFGSSPSFVDTSNDHNS